TLLGGACEEPGQVLERRRLYTFTQRLQQNQSFVRPVQFVQDPPDPKACFIERRRNTQPTPKRCSGFLLNSSLTASFDGFQDGRMKVGRCSTLARRSCGCGSGYIDRGSARPPQALIERPERQQSLAVDWEALDHRIHMASQILEPQFGLQVPCDQQVPSAAEFGRHRDIWIHSAPERCLALRPSARPSHAASV